MNIFKKVIFRIDIVNRFLVSISMILFIIIPSYELYYLTLNSSDEIILTLVNIIFVISILGNGIISLYKPIRPSFFFFFDSLFLLLFYINFFLDKTILNIIKFNVFPLYLTEVIIASIGLLLNFTYYIFFLTRKMKYKFEFNEKTNSDSFYNFLNGKNSNKEIENKVKELNKSNKVNILEKMKFSRFLRILSYLIYLIVFIISFINLLNNTPSNANISSNIIFYPLISSFVITTILILISVFIPTDFKYIYYFNSILFLSVLILASKLNQTTPIYYIVSLVVILISLLITMITEGRTWMGAKYDK